MRLAEGNENLLNIKPVLDVEMRARVAIHKGLPGNFNPRKLIDLVTLEVGVPETSFLHFHHVYTLYNVWKKNNRISRNERSVKMMGDYTIVLN